MSETGIHRVDRDQIQISEVQSPPGKRISWARTGPSGSLPKSTRKFVERQAAVGVSQSNCSRNEPALAMSG